MPKLTAKGQRIVENVLSMTQKEFDAFCATQTPSALALLDTLLRKYEQNLDTER